MSEKIYGICENKCLKEVPAKEEVILKDNFAVITKSTSNTFLLIDYPEGFNKDNTVVLSVQRGYVKHIQTSSEGVVTDSGAYLELNTIGLYDDNIQISRCVGGTYKVVLMKV